MTAAGRILLSLIVMALLATAHTDAQAQSAVVLVVADHRDPSSVPSSSEIFQNAYAEVAKQLKRKGLTPRRVADIPAARRMSGKIERNLGLAVEVARNANARISTVLGLKIFISMRRGSKNNSFYVWMDGEARSVAFGKVTATHEHRNKKRHVVEKSCGPHCMQERAAEVIAPTAGEFGEAMADKLKKSLRR